MCCTASAGVARGEADFFCGLRDDDADVVDRH